MLLKSTDSSAWNQDIQISPIFVQMSEYSSLLMTMIDISLSQVRIEK